jgi:hypothetical protein
MEEVAAAVQEAMANKDAAVEAKEAEHQKTIETKEGESIKRMEEVVAAVQEAMANKDAANAQAMAELQAAHEEALRKNADAFRILTRVAAAQNKNANEDEEDDGKDSEHGDDEEDGDDGDDDKEKARSRSRSSSPAVGMAAIASSIGSAFGWTGTGGKARSPSPPSWGKMCAPLPVTKATKPEGEDGTRGDALAAKGGSTVEPTVARHVEKGAEKGNSDIPSAGGKPPLALMQPAKLAELKQARALMAAMAQRITNPNPSYGGHLQIPKVAEWLSSDAAVQGAIDELATELRLVLEARGRMEDKRGSMQIAASALEGQMLCNPNATKTVALQLLAESCKRAQGAAKDAEVSFIAEKERHSEVLARLEAQLLELSAQKGPLEGITGFWGRNWAGQATRDKRSPTADSEQQNPAPS